MYVDCIYKNNDHNNNNKDNEKNLKGKKIAMRNTASQTPPKAKYKYMYTRVLSKSVCYVFRNGVSCLLFYIVTYINVYAIYILYYILQFQYYVCIWYIVGL